MKKLIRIACAAVLTAFLVTMPAAFAFEKVTYYHFDALGSPVAGTDEQGNVVWRKTYTPYGEETKTPSTPAEPRSFTGHVRDAETGLVYAGARYYDPVVGRFYGADPKSFTEGNPHSFNRYAYANNNPYAYIDPDGRAGVLIRPVIPPYANTGTADAAMRDRFVRGMEQLGDKFRDLLSRPFSNESSEQKPSLVEPDRAQHILGGDETGGGHRAGTGKPGKSEFPSDWSDERVLGEISDVATAPDSTRSRGRGGREVVRGTRGGVDIEVIVDPNDRIVTGYPTNAPRNPR